MPLFPARTAQVPWLTFSFVAVCTGLFTAFVLLNFGGTFNLRNSQVQAGASQQNIGSQLEGLMRVSTETLAAVQKASAEVAESAKKQARRENYYMTCPLSRSQAATYRELQAKVRAAAGVGLLTKQPRSCGVDSSFHTHTRLPC
jgi:hypothetical protein